MEAERKSPGRVTWESVMEKTTKKIVLTEAQGDRWERSKSSTWIRWPKGRVTEILILFICLLKSIFVFYSHRWTQVFSQSHSVSAFTWGAPDKQSHTGVSGQWLLPGFCNSDLEGKWSNYQWWGGDYKAFQTGPKVHDQQLPKFDSRPVEILQQGFLPSYPWRGNCGEELVPCRMSLGAQSFP